ADDVAQLEDHERVGPRRLVVERDLVGIGVHGDREPAALGEDLAGGSMRADDHADAVLRDAQRDHSSSPPSSASPSSSFVARSCRSRGMMASGVASRTPLRRKNAVMFLRSRARNSCAIGCVLSTAWPTSMMRARCLSTGPPAPSSRTLYSDRSACTRSA